MKTLNKNLMKIGIVAPFVFATGAANAISVDFGLLGTGDTFGAVQAYNISDVASYADDYSFQLAGWQTVSGFLANWLTPEGSTGTDRKVASDNMSVEFFKDGVSQQIWDPLNSGDEVVYSNGLGAGSYRIDVAGDVSGSTGSTYTLDATVSAIPEPSTYALMLGGLGLVGFMARRRKANLAVS